MIVRKILPYFLGTIYLLPICPSLGNNQHASNMCESLVSQYERQHGIPKNLLKAISLIESGRKVPGRGLVAWPWTINANGTPYVFETKAEAIAKVKALQAKGIQLIDVGCMQINLKHHPGAFNSLEEAFDPEKNIAYAAQFLSQKWESNNGNWIKAVGGYHNIKEEINKPYREKVMDSWSQLGSTIPTQTVFNVNANHNQPTNQLTRFGHTHFSGVRGRRIPIRVQFSPYNTVSAGTPVRTNGKLRSFSRASRLLHQRHNSPLQATSYTGEIKPKLSVSQRIIPTQLTSETNEMAMAPATHHPRNAIVSPSINSSIGSKTTSKRISWPLIKKQQRSGNQLAVQVKNPGSIFPQTQQNQSPKS